MKTLLLLFSLLVFTVYSVNAQNTFNKGDKVLNFAVGIGNSLYSGSAYTNRIPPLSASLEVGVKDNLFDAKSSLGIGGFLGYTGAKWDNSGHGWKYSATVLGARCALHYQLINKLDTYTGLMLGYDVVTSKWYGAGTQSSNTGTSSGFVWSLFLGGRYYFSEKFAGLLELGYGVSILKIGFAVKL
jgi:hypothetical protein